MFLNKWLAKIGAIKTVFVLFNTVVYNYWAHMKAVCFVIPQLAMFPSAAPQETLPVSGSQSILLKIVDARPGFIIKILKRSLIDKFIKIRAFDCQSAVFDR